MNERDEVPTGSGPARPPAHAAHRVDILLAEDNPDDVKLAMHAFRRNHLANAVHVVGDGAEALDFVFCGGVYADRSVEEPPKLLLLDLKMPLVDGLEVLRAVRADPRTRPIPVVMMTASHEEKDRVESYALGVNSYIVKPLDFDQFVEAMRLVGMYWLLVNKPPKG